MRRTDETNFWFAVSGLGRKFYGRIRKNEKVFILELKKLDRGNTLSF